MKIGDVVTTRLYGKNLQFLVLGYYTDGESGEEMAILSLLDPTLVITARKNELVATDLSSLFAKPSLEHTMLN